jgi:hypothetical protein
MDTLELAPSLMLSKDEGVFSAGSIVMLDPNPARRHSRFKESGIEREKFDAVVRPCIHYGGSPKESSRSSV